MDYVLSLSYGKDSMACLGAIKELGLPLDRIITVDVMASSSLSADLPPMIDFKSYADKIILSRYGLKVEHLKSVYSFSDYFFKISHGKSSKYSNCIYGFPFVNDMWCNSRLKTSVLKKAISSNDISYQGIAFDEDKRLNALHKRKNAISPLELIKWTETDCFLWCRSNSLLSPVYHHNYRDGCFFCPLQNTNSLRNLRKFYPSLWKFLLDLDSFSPSSFKPSGKTVHDYDRRFQAEDDGFLYPDDSSFRWNCLENGIQLRLFPP